VYTLIPAIRSTPCLPSISRNDDHECLQESPHSPIDLNNFPLPIQSLRNETIFCYANATLTQIFVGHPTVAKSENDKTDEGKGSKRTTTATTKYHFVVGKFRAFSKNVCVSMCLALRNTVCENVCMCASACLHNKLIW
jgi:hypothetical protein